MAWEDRHIRECGLAKGLVKELRLTTELYGILRGIAEYFERKREEYLAILTGREMERILLAENIYIPKQRRSSVSAEITEKIPEEISRKTVGLVHYHPGMSAFASGTDEIYSLNHRTSLIYNYEEKCMIAYVIRLPCGMLYRTEFEKCTLKELLYIPDVDNEKIKKITKEIVKKTEKRKEFETKKGFFEFDRDTEIAVADSYPPPICERCEQEASNKVLDYNCGHYSFLCEDCYEEEKHRFYCPDCRELK